MVAQTHPLSSIKCDRCVIIGKNSMISMKMSTAVAALVYHSLMADLSLPEIDKNDKRVISIEKRF